MHWLLLQFNCKIALIVIFFLKSSIIFWNFSVFFFLFHNKSSIKRTSNELYFNLHHKKTLISHIKYFLNRKSLCKKGGKEIGDFCSLCTNEHNLFFVTRVFCFHYLNLYLIIKHNVCIWRKIYIYKFRERQENCCRRKKSLFIIYFHIRVILSWNRTF